jgi:signal transduction histidine kinase
VIVMIDGVVWTADRQGSMDRDNETAEDLFMVGKEKKLWVNLYKAPNMPAGVAFGDPFDTEEEALMHASLGFPIATIPVEYVA